MPCTPGTPADPQSGSTDSQHTDMQTGVLCIHSPPKARWYSVLTLKIQFNIWPPASGRTLFSIIPLFQCLHSFLCRIPVFLVEIPFLPVRFPICACFNVCVCISCLSLLSYPLILHCPGSVILLFCVCVWVCCLNFSVRFQHIVYLCHTLSLSPKLDVLMRVWQSEKRGAWQIWSKYTNLNEWDMGIFRFWFIFQIIQLLLFKIDLYYEKIILGPI